MAINAGLMSAFGDWLKTTRMIEWSVWIGNTPLSNFLNQNNWITPTLQSIHLLAIALTFSAALMVNLRILGVGGQSKTLLEVEQRYIPWIWGGLATLVATGLVLLLAEPSRQMLNPFFWTKMVLVVVVTLANLWFQKSIQQDGAFWQPTRAGYGALKAGSLCMIAAWAAIMVMGRWIAYGV